GVRDFGQKRVQLTQYKFEVPGGRRPSRGHGGAPARLRPAYHGRGALNREDGTDRVADRSGAKGLGIDGAPDGFGPGQNGAVGGANEFAESLEFHPRGSANPGARDDRVREIGGKLVVDFVANHQPEGTLLVGSGGGGTPMRGGDVLDPSQVGDVVHVSENVDVRRVDGDEKFVHGGGIGHCFLVWQCAGRNSGWRDAPAGSWQKQ